MTRLFTPRRAGMLAGGAALLALLIVAAAASGNKTPKRAPTAPATTTAPATNPAAKAAFISQANAICTQLDTQARAAAPSGTDLASYAKDLPVLVSALQQAATSLGQLHPPPDASGLLTSYVALLGRQVSDARAAASAANANDNAGFQRAMQALLAGGEQPTAAEPPEMVAAAKYGLTACSE